MIKIAERDWEFEKKGYQERNIENLVKVLGKKEATDALKGLGEIDTESWVNMNSTVGTLKEIIDLGGASVVVGDFKEHVKGVVEDNVALAIAPLKNQISVIVSEYLKPVYDIINDVGNDMSGLISDYKTGAFWGAMVGSIWGDYATMLGAFLGAAFQGFWEDAWPTFCNDVIVGVAVAIKEWWKGLFEGGKWYDPREIAEWDLPEGF